MEPESVVQHESKETLLWSARFVAVAAYTSAVLASSVGGQRKGHLVQTGFFRSIEVFHLDAVVGMNSPAVGYEKVVAAQPIVVRDDVDPWRRSPFDLSAKTGPVIGGEVRLPSVDEPRLNLQMGRWENLYAHAVEKPRCVGGNVRRLVGPIVEVVVAEQADVREKDSRIHVHPVQHIKVVSAVGFRNVAISADDIPLPVAWAGVIPRGGCRIHAELRHQPRANVVVMKVAAHSELFELHFTRAKKFARSPDRMVGRMIEIHHVVHIGPDLGSKELGVPEDLFRAGIPVQPCPVRV